LPCPASGQFAKRPLKPDFQEANALLMNQLAVKLARRPEFKEALRVPTRFRAGVGTL
jgi:hypothetical protein